MTQVSRPQSGRLVDGYVDAGGYTADQWARIYSTLFTLDETTEGVIKHLSDLEVTNPGSPSDDISVASGAALVRGHWFVNEDQATPAGASDVDFVPTTPAADRIDRVVLVQNNTDLAYDGTADYGSAVLEVPADLTDYDGVASVPAHTCRLAILIGVSGGAMRALTQDVAISGDIWMLEIARYTISAAGVISSLTDYRAYVPQVTTENIADDAVTTDKILDENVTAAKIANRTRTFFVPALGGYGATDGMLVNGGVATGHTVPGVLVDDAGDTYVGGSFACPADWAVGTDMTITLIIRTFGGALADGAVLTNYVGACRADGFAWDSMSWSSGPTQVTSASADRCLYELPVTVPQNALLTANSIFSMLFTRSGNDGDDGSHNIGFMGWLVSYTADS